MPGTEHARALTSISGGPTLVLFDTGEGRTMAGLRILCVLAVAALASLAATAPAQGQLMGDLPTVKLVDNTLVISGFRANRGLVQAGANDRFTLVTQLTVFGSGGTFALEPCQDPLLADEATGIKQGSEVSLLPVVTELTSEQADKVMVGDEVDLTASLVLTDAAGGVHVLDTLTFTKLVVSSP